MAELNGIVRGKTNKIADQEIDANKLYNITDIQGISLTNAQMTAAISPEQEGLFAKDSVYMCVDNGTYKKDTFYKFVVNYAEGTADWEEVPMGGDPIVRFPNATIIGTPLIQDGQVSNFSDSNYMQFPFIVDMQDRAFEIDFAFTTGSDVATQQNILDSQFGLALAISNSRGLMAISNNGTTWDIGTQTGTNVILPNTTYYAKVVWDKTKYVTSLSTNGTDYVEDMVINSTLQPSPKTIFIGGSYGLFGTGTAHPFLGSINMNKASLKIAGLTVWVGMDDAGLATRADVSLSNIDQAGIDRIKDIAGGGSGAKMYFHDINFTLTPTMDNVACKGVINIQIPTTSASQITNIEQLASLLNSYGYDNQNTKALRISNTFVTNDGIVKGYSYGIFAPSTTRVIILYYKQDGQGATTIIESYQTSNWQDVVTELSVSSTVTAEDEELRNNTVQIVGTEKGLVMGGATLGGNSSRCIAIGQNLTHAYNSTSIAIGDQAQAEGTRAIVMGAYAGARNTDSIQLGQGSNNKAKTLQLWEDNIYNGTTHTLSVQNLTDGTTTKTMTEVLSGGGTSVTVGGVAQSTFDADTKANASDVSTIHTMIGEIDEELQTQSQSINNLSTAIGNHTSSISSLQSGKLDKASFVLDGTTLRITL